MLLLGCWLYGCWLLAERTYTHTYTHTYVHTYIHRHTDTQTHRPYRHTDMRTVEASGPPVGRCCPERASAATAAAAAAAAGPAAEVDVATATGGSEDSDLGVACVCAGVCVVGLPYGHTPRASCPLLPELAASRRPIARLSHVGPRLRGLQGRWPLWPLASCWLRWSPVARRRRSRATSCVRPRPFGGAPPMPVRPRSPRWPLQPATSRLPPRCIFRLFIACAAHDTPS